MIALSLLLHRLPIHRPSVKSAASTGGQPHFSPFELSHAVVRARLHSTHTVLFTRISFAIVLASSRIVTMKATRQIISNSLTQTIVMIAYKGLSESGPPIPIDGRGFPSDGYAGHRKGLKCRRSCRAEASQLIVTKISLNPLAIDFHDTPSATPQAEIGHVTPDESGAQPVGQLPVTR